MVALQISPTIKIGYGLGVDWVDKPQNYKDLYGIWNFCKAPI